MARAAGAALGSLVLAVGAPAAPGHSATTALDTAGAAPPGAVRVHLDCRDCGRDDLDYLRTSLPFVDHVRDRAAAEVHLLVTWQPTGAGGAEYTLTFLGRGRFAGVDDTLRFAARASDTQETIRRAGARLMGLGLVRYAAHSPAAARLAVRAEGGPGPAVAPADRWNHWVFTSRLNGFVQGQSRTGTTAVFWSQSASRVLPGRKFGFTVSGDYRESRFTLADGRRLLSVWRSRSAGGRYVRGHGEHWSTMVRGRVMSSIYENIAFQAGLGPGLEYNLFPYGESTRRQLRFDYTAGGRFVRYRETTIYDRREELLFRQGLEIILDSKETWGTSQVRLEAEHYLHDVMLNRLRASGSTSLRVSEGLSLDVSASAERIHDQLSLPRKEATDEEVLLQRRLLATDYQFSFSVGVSYTFGSIYSGVVNARFGTGI